MRIDKSKFFTAYREKFADSPPQPTVDGLNYFLDRFETETRLSGIPQFAYVLATAYHESGKTRLINGKKVIVRFQPVRETRERADSPRRANQDRYWKTGFYGRGFPQTTWERNYLKSGQALGLGDLFVKNPDLLLEPQYAYDAMVVSMAKGLYTGKKLGDFINDADTDYTNARRVINGTDRAGLIADYAKKFEQILKVSAADSPAQPPAPTSNGKLEPATNNPPPKPLPPSKPLPPPDITIDNIEKVNIEKQNPLPSGTQTVKREAPNVFSKIAAAIVAITGLGINVGSLIQSRIENLTGIQLAYMGGALALAAIGLWLWQRSMERANERTLKMMDAAADPSKNNVVIKN